MDTLRAVGLACQLIVAMGYFIAAILALFKDNQTLAFRYQVLFLLWLLLFKSGL